MRTVLYGIHLFNDDFSKHGHHFCKKQKDGEREQDGGETERESVCVRDRVWQREEVASVVKTAIEENGIVGIRIKLRC
jgi:hypothetical protein